MALCVKSVASGLSVRRSARAVSQKLAVPTLQHKRIALARAEPESTPSSSTPASSDETVQKLQVQAEEALKFVQGKWESTENSEKPAAIAIILGVVVAQIAIGATIDAIDKIPIVNKGLQLIGVAVTSLFLYRYTTDPEERASVKTSLDSFIKSVTGEK